MNHGNVEIVTFKVGKKLKRQLQQLPNCSEFIRAAVLTALENSCPLCGGTGILSPEQKHHWDSFSKNHSLSECRSCNAVHIVCKADGRVKKRGKE